MVFGLLDDPARHFQALLQQRIRHILFVVHGLYDCEWWGEVVEGDIVATQQVVLHKSAVVSGDIQSPSLVIEEGAQFNGAVRMSSDSASSGDTSSVSPIRSQDAKPAGEKSKVS